MLTLMDYVSAAAFAIFWTFVFSVTATLMLYVIARIVMFLP